MMNSGNQLKAGCKRIIMITIDLKLFVTLSKYLPRNSENFEVSKGTTVGKLIRNLSIPDELVKLIFINGVRKNRDTRLQHNDRVGLFPPVGGG